MYTWFCGGRRSATIMVTITTTTKGCGRLMSIIFSNGILMVWRQRIGNKKNCIILNSACARHILIMDEGAPTYTDIILSLLEYAYTFVVIIFE